MTHEFLESAEFTDNMTFGEFLRKKRRLLGLNQTDFAELLGYGQNTISRWEVGNGSPPFEDARKIVDFLGGDIKIVNSENSLERNLRLNELVNNYLQYGITQVF